MRTENSERRALLSWTTREGAGLVFFMSFTMATFAGPQVNQQGTSQQAGPESSTRTTARPAPDIISDNLDRVAASADQILEVLNREAGLMVELKRLLAQDAGVTGQILEESDLTDGAVAERLRSDLRARVLATRLLQRYGYLVPRLNPDSDLGAERKLVLQERAQVLARAGERRDTVGETEPARQNGACDPLSAPECQMLPTPTENRSSLPTPPTAPARTIRSAPLQRAADVTPGEVTRPEGTVASPELRQDLAADLGAPEIGRAHV